MAERRFLECEQLKSFKMNCGDGQAELSGYKALAGTWQFEKYRLTIDHVQGDPFASPSSLHVELPHRQAGFRSDIMRIVCQNSTQRLYCP